MDQVRNRERWGWKGALQPRSEIRLLHVPVLIDGRREPKFNLRSFVRLVCTFEDDLSTPSWSIKPTTQWNEPDVFGASLWNHDPSTLNFIMEPPPQLSTEFLYTRILYNMNHLSKFQHRQAFGSLVLLSLLHRQGLALQLQPPRMKTQILLHQSLPQTPQLFHLFQYLPPKISHL